MKCIEKIIWLYEEESSDITGLSEKDIKGNIYVYLLDSILDNETIILSTGPKSNSIITKKISDSFFWDIMINLRTGECEVWVAGD